MGVGQDEGVEAFDPQVFSTLRERALTHVCIQSRFLELHDMSLSFILHKTVQRHRGAEDTSFPHILKLSSVLASFLYILMSTCLSYLKH